MKNKYPLIFLSGLIIISLVSNSCKKDNSGTIENLMTRGTWQLASIIVSNYLGGNNTSTDTLNTKCGLNQTFSFTTDGTCTYQDFACIQQNVKGSWSLSDDKLTLISTLSCQDTTSTGAPTTTKPFYGARIVNVGQFSLVLETGDINTYYLPTQVRHIRRYGFIR